jgi:hypothetical protein
MNNGIARGKRQAHGVVSEMRLLVEAAAEAPHTVYERDQLERAVSCRITTALMVLLLVIIFATSAVPDVGPSLMSAIQAHF